MVDISRRTYEINYVETIEGSDGIFWLDGKHKEVELDHTKFY